MTATRTPAVLLVAFAAACLATACGATSDDDTGSTGGSASYAIDATFTIGLRDDPGTFDPYHSQLIFGEAYLAYDSLLNLAPDGEFVSGLAETWTADANGATFTLREDVTCSDGAPLTASDVAAAITFVSDPANQSPQYGVYTPTVSLTATGDDAARTVEVTVAEPFGFLLHTVGQLPIVCARGLADPDLLRTESDGTGPFVLTDVVPGQTYTFTRRDDYAWGPDGAGTDQPGMPKQVVLRIVTNESTRANLLLSGEINFALITGRDWQRLDAQGLDKVVVPSSGAWLWFNQVDGRVTQDKKVRQALVQSLDFEELVAVSTGETGSLSDGLITAEPKACPGDTVSGQLPGFDVAASEALLDEAGWAAGADGLRAKDGVPLTIDLHFVPSITPDYQPAAELVAQKWEELGIRVELTSDTFTTMNQFMFETSDYDVYLGGFGFGLPHQAVPYLSGPVPPDGTNLSGLHNAEYEELVAQAQALTPPEACEYWGRAEQALFRNLDLVPISNRPWPFYLQHAEARTSSTNFPVPTSMRVLR
ncbi:ABC transporter substrate-binding protein [Jiangella ureilytica]|uniref:ABC transporter substrate-binding protein n=1 Tax=Jiangella ureilytica TaxID=2530374 RepID=A0A4R4RUF0_9ACTN|nr:ABC transporter substrate-binding protein [Jiangella ureilytica]TDC53276.1 ABC transporter substrate-binding protein [Jiangella ureilytica]